jgi:hypothetical protein
MNDKRPAAFRYSDEQWRALEAIVARAGGDEARTKFATGRVGFEKQAGGYRERIATWDGLSYGGGNADQKKYERIERAARELAAALDDYGSWIALANNADELLHLREGLSRVAPRAGKMAATGRKNQNLMRNRFFLALARSWHSDLGLRIAVSVDSHLVNFIEAAMKGVWEKPIKKGVLDQESPKDIISKVLQGAMKP